ncbi:MAG: hypothetical protein HYX69_23360 [Planctomycetia bacterium]|nr:hypothetical protein [Planctomycetia bacterium]
MHRRGSADTLGRMKRGVIAYHSTFGAYGFWLPNDPRGSWSHEVRAMHLRPFGAPRSPGTRRSVAKRPHDVAARREAKRHLLRPAVMFGDEQIDCLAASFSELIQRMEIPLFAAALMPDQEVHRAVRYVEQNPVKAGRAPQRWTFLTPYPAPER